MQRQQMTEEMNRASAACAERLLNGPLNYFHGLMLAKYGDQGVAVCIDYNVLVACIGKLMAAEGHAASGDMQLPQVLKLANQIADLINDYRYKLRCQAAGELN